MYVYFFILQDDIFHSALFTIFEESQHSSVSNNPERRMFHVQAAYFQVISGSFFIH